MISIKSKVSRKWIVPALLASSFSVAGIAQASVGTISGFVWLDLNADGSQSSNEPAVPGVGISLLDEDNNNALVDGTVSGADGAYQFSNLDFSKYFVHFELPAGCEFTQSNVNNNSQDTLDSDVRSADGLAAVERLRSVNPNSFNIDAGLFCPDANITLPTETTADNVSIELGLFFSGNFLANDNLSTEAIALELVNGGLPAGLEFGTGANGFDLGSVFGVPTEAGTFNFAYQVADVGGTFDIAIVTIKVVDIGDDSIGVANDDRYHAEVNRPFSVNLIANDTFNDLSNLRDTTVDVIAGEVPPGLEIHGLSNITGSGALAGRPTAEGTYRFSYQTRELRSGRTTDTAIVTVVVDETNNPLVARNDVVLDHVRRNPIDGNLGFPFNFFENDSFAGTPSMTVVSGRRPKIGVAGNLSFEYQISSESGTSNIAAATVVVYPSGVERFVSNDVSVGIAGEPLSFNVLANDELADQVVAVELLSPDLPPGLTFSRDGMLVGTPTTAGNTRFLYQVSNTRGDTETAIVTVAISEPGSTVTVARDDFITMRAGWSRGVLDNLLNNDMLGANVQLVEVISGTLPPGVKVNDASGISTDHTKFLFGEPNTVGNYVFTYRVVGLDGSSDTATVTAVVVN